MSLIHKRLWIVDFLRQLSIVLVLICHYDQSINHGKSHTLRWLAPGGDIGVWIFFVVSGFVIAKSTAERDGSLSRIHVREFYVLRAARLLPLFLAIIGSGVLGSYFFPKSALLYSYVYGSGMDSKNWLFWLAIFTSTFNWIKVFFDAVFGIQWDIFWSLSVEEQFYAVFPWASGLHLVKKNFTGVLILLCAIAPLGRSLFHHFKPGYHSAQNSFLALDLICFGIILQVFLEHFESKLKQQHRLCIALVLAGALITLLVLTRERSSGADVIFLPTVLGIGVFSLLAGGLCIPWFQRLPPMLVGCGELSYGAYLLHPLVLMILAPLLFQLNWFVGLPLFAALTMCVARLSFNYFERPLSRAIRQKLLPNNLWSSGKGPSKALQKN